MKKTGKLAKTVVSVLSNNIISVENVNLNIDWKCIMAVTLPITLALTILLVILFFSPELRDAFIRYLISKFID